MLFNGACERFSLVNLDEKNEIRTKYADGRPFFVFVGSIHPRKNVERLLQAFSIYHKKYSEYHLVIVEAICGETNPFIFPLIFKNL